MTCRALWSVAVVWALALSGQAEEIKSPLEPQEALKQFSLDPGLSIELVACEPEVIDPVAIRFDEAGRLWVVEMRDYPHGPPEGQPPLSTIRVLTDRDGDGRYETARLFAEHLLFPTGLQPWRGGVIVTLAGEVAYLKDTDGDGRADLHEVWYRGFVAENPQLRANHPRFGIDNRVYIANGLRGGTVADPRRPEQQPLSISGRDFSFDPLSGDCEAVSGNGQFGNALDDFGNRFVCNNRAPLDHVVLENRYLARNPFLAVPTVLANVAAQGELSHVFPLTSAWTTSNLHAGQFTAACGIEIFRGDGLTPEYYGNSLTCEPTGSLVHREIVRPDGVTFSAQPANEAREFLASRDSWFRPVNLETGPHGALYVVDMYRAVIEHPQYMPVELQTRPDLHLGNDRGRIYRVVRAAKKSKLSSELTHPKQTSPQLSKASAPELVSLLANTNSWQRETAARLLYERQDPQAIAPLEAQALEGKSAVARAGALVALAGMKKLSNDVLCVALEAVEPRVREQAAALIEGRLEVKAIRQAVLKLAGDADDRVRFRAALVLGGASGPDVTAALLRISLARPADKWTQLGVATARPETIAPLLVAALQVPEVQVAKADAPEGQVVRDLATIVGSRREAAEVASVLVALDDLPGNVAVGSQTLVGLGVGLERRGAALVDFVKEIPESARFVHRIQAAFERSAVRAADARLNESERGLTVEVLKYAGSPQAQEVLVRLITSDPSQSLRVQAAASLRPTTTEVAQALLAGYATQSPTVRRAILDALVEHPQSALALLAAVDKGDIARVELDTARENRLRQHGDESVRSLALKLLTTATPAERKAVLADYQTSLALQADPRNGRELFRKHCSICHRIGDLGVNVAPDISDSRVKTPAQLLSDILNPNQAIDNNYVSYTVVTSGGSTHVGIIASETASSLSLRQAEDKTVTLLRADIEAIRSNGVSLMPEGFEKQLSQQQVADVISFVKNWRYLDAAGGSTIGAPAR